MNNSIIYDAINHFVFAAKPSSSDSSAPATVKDINNLVKEIAALAKVIAKNIDD